MDDSGRWVCVDKESERRQDRQIVDCVVAPRYQLFRCAFQRVQERITAQFLSA